MTKKKRDNRRTPTPRPLYPIGEDPHDPDAHPDSGWVYPKWEDPEPDRSPIIKPHHIGMSGMPCNPPTCNEELVVVDEHTIEEVVAPVVPEGEEVSLNVPDKTEKVLALACSKHGYRMQMRESALPKKRHPLR